ncbi:sortase [Patescibacteria group bacterium]|nr:sortase [Patescibacteria group bacterium]
MPQEKLEKKNNFLTRQKIIFLVGTLAVITIGYLFFSNWQNSSDVIQISNQEINRLPTSAAREIITQPTLERGEADQLSIPDRDINTPIIYIEEVDETIFQEALASGVVHYPGTALPGQFGNPYIFGHSSDYFWKSGNYKEIFKSLIDIPLGTPIRITNHDGELFIYRVVETKIVGPKEVSVLDQNEQQSLLLTLQTSWPVGTALKRYIVIAEMDKIATFGPTP